MCYGAQAAAEAEAAREEAAAHQAKERELWAQARATGNEASHIASTKVRATGLRCVWHVCTFHFYNSLSGVICWIFLLRTCVSNSTCLLSFRTLIVVAYQASMFGGMQSSMSLPVQVVSKPELVLAGEE